MMMKHVTLTFNVEKEIDAKIYYVVKNLSKYYKKFYDIDDLSESEALIRYVYDLGNSLLDCENRKEKCERMLDLFSRKHVQH